MWLHRVWHGKNVVYTPGSKECYALSLKVPQLPICRTDASDIFPQRFHQFPAPAFRAFPAAPDLDFGVMWLRLVFWQTV